MHDESALSIDASVSPGNVRLNSSIMVTRRHLSITGWNTLSIMPMTEIWIWCEFGWGGRGSWVGERIELFEAQSFVEH